MYKPKQIVETSHMNSNLRHKNTNTNQKTKTQYNSATLTPEL